ncbi:hypothetical protein J2Y02_005537 [Neobacillus drentensis]|nr:hypothetical protein [Neobacillus drentensis]
MKSVDIYLLCVDITGIAVDNVVNNLGGIIRLKYYILSQFGVHLAIRR